MVSLSQSFQPSPPPFALAENLTTHNSRKDEVLRVLRLLPLHTKLDLHYIHPELLHSFFWLTMPLTSWPLLTAPALSFANTYTPIFLPHHINHLHFFK